MVHFCAPLLLPRFRGNMSAKPQKKGGRTALLGQDKEEEPMLQVE